ncbi:MAG: hypothetical protein K2X47_05320 [Bdellovibrionales bacterium]|nr:hypothetical protein [Bdellovibrionales bacterium]
MRNLFLSFFLIFASVPSFAQQGPSIMELRAVEVSYFGGITGFDKAGYKTLRAAIGSLIADGTVAQFKTTAVGMEGGSTFCVELADDPTLKISAITDLLEIIKPSAITVYSHNLLRTCAQ